MIFVSGSTSAIGMQVVKDAVKRDLAVTPLSRNARRECGTYFDLFNSDSYANIRPGSVLIHIAWPRSLRRQMPAATASVQLADYCSRSRIDYVFLSSSLASSSISCYGSAKRTVENYLEQSTELRAASIRAGLIWGTSLSPALVGLRSASRFIALGSPTQAFAPIRHSPIHLLSDLLIRTALTIHSDGDLLPSGPIGAYAEDSIELSDLNSWLCPNTTKVRLDLVVPILRRACHLARRYPSLSFRALDRAAGLLSTECRLGLPSTDCDWPDSASAFREWLNYQLANR